MNDVPARPTGAAVFLSYASRDAAAARRICETLREAGVDVWFDVDGGLEHGDEWDAKIRKQIKECVLFIPIISASTQARLEGYFRIEWELAAQRAMGIASGVPFILPVVIDDTRESEALVPDRFRAVQWTRLPGGVVSPDVKARFLKMWSLRRGMLKHEPGLSGREPGLSRHGDGGEGVASAVPMRKDRRVAAWSAALLVLVVAIAATGGWQFRKAAPTKTAEKTLAVLPFVTAGGDKDEESLSDGIADELLTQLGRAPGLRVSGRMSSFSFRGQKLTESEIARRLEVEYLVTGTFQKNGSQVRIRASLVNAADGFSLWGETFTKELTSVFALQDEIAGLIAQKLQLKFGGAARAQRTVDPAAYGLTQKGRYLWLKRSDEALAEAQTAYEEAIAIAPGFAEAHAGLADVCLVRGWYLGLEGMNQGGRLFARARQAAQEAVRLDPTLAEPHAALAALDLNEERYEASEREFQAALRLNPNYSYAHHWRAHLLAVQGRIDEAVASMARATQIDPFSLSTLVIRSVFLAHAGQHREAVAVGDRGTAGGVPAGGWRAGVESSHDRPAGGSAGGRAGDYDQPHGETPLVDRYQRDFCPASDGTRSGSEGPRGTPAGGCAGRLVLSGVYGGGPGPRGRGAGRAETHARAGHGPRHGLFLRHLGGDSPVATFSGGDERARLVGALPSGEGHAGADAEGSGAEEMRRGWVRREGVIA